MTCATAVDAIWDRLREYDGLPPAIEEHVLVCEPCQREWEARVRLSRSLERYRRRSESEVADELAQRVLRSAKQAVRQDALAPFASGHSRQPRGSAVPVDLEAHTDVGVPESQQRWEATAWVAVLFVLLWTASALGFFVGQSSVVTLSPPPPDPVWERQPSTHQVRLSPHGLAALDQGNTYLLVGPTDGPYQVVDVTSWEAIDLEGVSVSEWAAHARRGSAELVVAVGPAGGWSRGIEVGVADLTERGGEILARRALPQDL